MALRAAPRALASGRELRSLALAGARAEQQADALWLRAVGLFSFDS